MVKKGLGDLLREEAQKNLPADTAADTSQDSTDLGEQMSQADNSLAATESADRTDSNRAKRATLTKADLEALVNELRISLEENQKYTNSLEQQLAELKSDLQTQKSSVHKLKAELKEVGKDDPELKVLRSEVDKIDKIKAELEDAKKLILQLSETNTKSNKTAITPSRQERQPESKTKQALTISTDRNTHQTTASDRIIHVAPPSSKTLSNADIGWVD